MIKQHFMHSLHQPENTRYILILKIGIASVMILLLTYFSFKNNCGNVELDADRSPEENSDAENVEKIKINKFLDYPDICYDVQVFIVVEEKPNIQEKQNDTAEELIVESSDSMQLEDDPNESKPVEHDDRPKIIAYIVVGILLISAVKAVYDVLKP